MSLAKYLDMFKYSELVIVSESGIKNRITLYRNQGENISIIPLLVNT